jgi:hypothetical protein
LGAGGLYFIGAARMRVVDTVRDAVRTVDVALGTELLPTAQTRITHRALVAARNAIRMFTICETYRGLGGDYYGKRDPTQK